MLFSKSLVTIALCLAIPATALAKAKPVDAVAKTPKVKSGGKGQGLSNFMGSEAGGMVTDLGGQLVGKGAQAAYNAGRKKKTLRSAQACLYQGKLKEDQKAPLKQAIAQFQSTKAGDEEAEGALKAATMAACGNRKFSGKERRRAALVDKSLAQSNRAPARKK